MKAIKNLLTTLQGIKYSRRMFEKEVYECSEGIEKESDKTINNLINTVSKCFVHSYKLDILTDDLILSLLESKNSNKDKDIDEILDEKEDLLKFIGEILDPQEATESLAEKVNDTLRNVLIEQEAEK